MAVAALPEIGRMNITGSIDEGTPKGRSKYEPKPHKSFNAPLAANIRVAHMSIIRLGKIRMLVAKPSLAPLMNSSPKFS